jgi:hypothetical protein
MAIKKIKLPDGRELTIDEWLHWPTYSTIEFAKGSKVSLRAFTYVQGQRVSQQGVAPRNATEADTNQVVKSQANYDEALLVYSITYECFALSPLILKPGQSTNLVADAPVLTAVNHRRLCRDLMVELYIGARQQKPQARFPFSYIGQGLGSPAYVPGDSPGLPLSQYPPFGIFFQYGTGGLPTPQNQRRFPLPIYIPPTQAFHLLVYSPLAINDLDQDVRQRWYLDGLKRRPTG